jgi:hypothetical protein
MKHDLGGMVSMSSIIRPPYTSFIDWFDPDNKTHLSAYAELQKTGLWPQDFYYSIPLYVKFPVGWAGMLAMKLADLYIKKKLEQ